MPLKARCPTCGKSARFPEAEAGLPAVCAACGTRYVVPDVPSRDESIAGSADGPAQGGLGWAGWLVAVFALGAAGLAVAVALNVGFLRDNQPAAVAPPTTKPSAVRPPPAPPVPGVDARQVATLKADAEALAVDGLYKEAHRKYREIEILVAGKRVDDPHVRRLIDDARTERQQIFQRFIQPADPTAQDAPPPTTPTTAPSPEPPAPTQAAAPRSARPALQPVPEPAATSAVGDAEIGRAIEKATDFLLAQFDEKTSALRSAGDLNGALPGGSNALAVYALLQAGRATGDARLNIKGARMEAMLEAMKRARLNAGHPQTYARGIRATALALFDRPEDRGILREDLVYLLKNHKQGAYTYNPITDAALGGNAGPVGFRYKGDWDNSNSQYGLLGVWAGAETGAIIVPRAYWSFVEQHWTGSQLKNGTWPYNDEPTGTLSMTVAGVASLFVTQDYLHGASYAVGKVGRPPFTPALRKALQWLEEGDHVLDVDTGGWPAYTLYGVERAGLASGFKYFGAHDWYRVHARRLVDRQRPDGGWGDVNDTSFCLLFLARGRHPILMNKLRFDTSEGAPIAAVADADDDAPPPPDVKPDPKAADAHAGFWNNYPRDLANLARFAGKQLERDLNFQVVSLGRPFYDWLDCPVLYIASHRAPQLSAADKQNLKAFVEAGGLLFTHADGDSPEFNGFAESLANTLWGEKYEMRNLPGDHPLFSVVFKVNDPPTLRVVSNGSRLLMVHSPVDLARTWQSKDEKGMRSTFDLGINLFLYAAGKRDLRNRLDSPYISDPGSPPPNGKVALARLTYNGNWDPEPGAFPRFSRWMHRQTGTGVDAQPIPIGSISPGMLKTFPVAHLTGTAKAPFSVYDVKAIKSYVEAGGVLIVDPCGGSPTFRDSVNADLIAKAFPQSRPRTVTRGHPLVTPGLPGMDDLAKPRVRQYTMEATKDAGAGTFEVISAGKGHVVLLPIDLTTGLLGTGTWGIVGYEPGYALDLLKNVIFWTADGQRDE